MGSLFCLVARLDGSSYLLTAPCAPDGANTCRGGGQGRLDHRFLGLVGVGEPPFIRIHIEHCNFNLDD